MMRALNGKTPYEMVNGKKPYLGGIQEFGVAAYVKTSRQVNLTLVHRKVALWGTIAKAKASVSTGQKSGLSA